MRSARQDSHQRKVAFIAGVASVGGFLFGFDNGSTAGTIGYLTDYFELSPAGVGWVASGLTLGALLGVAVAGRLSDANGRRSVLMLAAVLLAVGAAGEALAANEFMLIASRIVLGFGIGAETMIAPLYIAEIAPPNRRGELVSFNQLANTIGNVTVFSVSAFLAFLASEAWLTDNGWRVIFACGVVPSVIFFFLLRRAPESPRWLVKRGRPEEALAILESIAADRESARDELRAIQNNVDLEQGWGLRELFRPRYRKALLIAAGMGLFQQVTGINAVFYYAPETFRAAGLGNSAAMLSTVFIGAISVVATVVSIRLIDRVGRRTLLLIGSSVMLVANIAQGLVFNTSDPNGTLLVLLVLVFAGVFALSFGTVAYVLIAEVFPLHLRGIGASVGTFSMWSGTFAIAQFFPMLVAGIGSSATFFLLAALTALSLVFVIILVPETSGKSLETLEAELHRDDSMAKAPFGGPER